MTHILAYRVASDTSQSVHDRINFHSYPYGPSLQTLKATKGLASVPGFEMYSIVVQGVGLWRGSAQRIYTAQGYSARARIDKTVINKKKDP